VFGKQRHRLFRRHFVFVWVKHFYRCVNPFVEPDWMLGYVGMRYPGNGESV